MEDNPVFSAYIETDIENTGYHSLTNISVEESKQNIASYYEMITMTDEYIGKILDHLNELELTYNTIILITSDHGHLFRQHGLHDKGGFHYENLLKIPFIVRYPSNIYSAT